MADDVSADPGASCAQGSSPPYAWTWGDGSGPGTGVSAAHTSPARRRCWPGSVTGWPPPPRPRRRLTFDETVLDELLALARQYGVRAVVGSNWFYSDLTRAVREELDRLRGQYQVVSVTLEYSKRSTKADPMPPTHAELPHALQFLQSTGLLDLSAAVGNGAAASEMSTGAPLAPSLPRLAPAKREAGKGPASLLDVTGDRTTVEVRFKGNGFPVTVRSQADHPAGRARRLVVELQGADGPATFLGDFDVGYDWEAGEATHHGGWSLTQDSRSAVESFGTVGQAPCAGLTFRPDTDSGAQLSVHRVVEHNMRTMYTRMVAGLDEVRASDGPGMRGQPLATSTVTDGRDPVVLTLEAYRPFVRTLAAIHRRWVPLSGTQ
jgi:predicted dehydrogenase